MSETTFKWDDAKDQINRKKHGISFYEAQKAFLDPRRVIAEDLEHSHSEKKVLLFWQSWWRDYDSKIHIQSKQDPHYWRGSLAQGEKDTWKK